MKLVYYQKNMSLGKVSVSCACPGCGRLDQLTIRSIIRSYAHDLVEWYVGCNCGWCGPYADSPDHAGFAWDVRIVKAEVLE